MEFNSRFNSRQSECGLGLMPPAGRALDLVRLLLNSEASNEAETLKIVSTWLEGAWDPNDTSPNDGLTPNDNFELLPSPRVQANAPTTTDPQASASTTAPQSADVSAPALPTIMQHVATLPSSQPASRQPTGRPNLYIVLRTDPQRSWALGVWEQKLEKLTDLLELPPEGLSRQSAIYLRCLRSPNQRLEAERHWQTQMLPGQVIYHCTPL